MTAVAALLVILGQQPIAAVAPGAPVATDAAPAAADTMEGRPASGDLSPLQARIDAASPGAVVEVAAGDYAGDLYIDRPIRLMGRPGARLIGSGAGSVIRVRANDVTIEGFEIDGREGGSLARDSAGIHVSGHRVAIRRCRISRALFGVYLRAADEAIVEDVTIAGLRGRAPGEQGSGIHLWNTQGFRIVGNTIHDSRDGFYIQSSSGGYIGRNTVSDVRYGLHYMFSDGNVFEDNTFERSAAGAAIMYSRLVTFRRNRFLHNRGFASVGLLLKACEDVIAEDNAIVDNARGVFIEGTSRAVFLRNLIADADVAVVLYDSTRDTRFAGNAFTGNLSPLQLSGRRTDTVFDGNYWSDDTGSDWDGDGRRDQPYRLSNPFDHLRGNLTAADLFAQGLGARVLAAAEASFPVLEPIPVLDAHPLARLPQLPVTASAASRPSAGWPAWLWLAVAASGIVPVISRGARALRTEEAR